MRFGQHQKFLISVRSKVVLHRKSILYDQASGDENSTFLYHQVCGLFVYVRAVLDRLDSGSECSHDANLAVAMRSYDSLSSSSLICHSFHFFFAKLLVDWIIKLATNTSTATYLDDIGAGTELHPDSFETFRNSVCELHWHAVIASIVEPGLVDSMDVGVPAGNTLQNS